MIGILISGAVAVVMSLVMTPLVIRWFHNRGVGQVVRQGQEYPLHQAKAGTPTMGGVAFVTAAVIGFLAGHLADIDLSPSGILMLFVFIGMAVVGYLDDMIKLRHRRSLGLSKTAKFLGQAGIAALVAWAGPAWAGWPLELALVGDLAVAIPWWLYAVLVFLIIAGFSNAVNLTDGLDGLAAGSSALVFGAYTIVGFWMFRNPTSYPGVEAQTSLDVAVMAAAGMAACAGFLWFNAPPAKVYMGDTGSLALGGLFAAMSLATGTHLLLGLLGGLFVMEVLSVILQVFTYRVLDRRILRMAPVHHHFEVVGWAEATVVVRFWIIAGLGVTLGLVTFYAEWIGRVGVGP
jgi:phospho-N-acetylmuramoyl-pentapeptide-transferase